MFSQNLVVLVSLFALSFGQLCPPAEQIEPCHCSETLESVSCSRIPADTDLKAIFDLISAYNNESTIFKELSIVDTELAEIPPNTAPTLKFRELHIYANFKLQRISPEAFRDTHAVSTVLNFQYNDLFDDNEVFGLVNQFQKAESVYLWVNRLSSVPENALTGMPNLERLLLGTNLIKSVSKSAFVGLPRIGQLDLAHNQLQASNISLDAFTGITSTGIQLGLDFNNQISYLDETVFQPILGKVATLTVGGAQCEVPPAPCTYVYMDCDSRADWLCSQVDTVKPKLLGFLCEPSTGFENVWNYCDSLKR